MGISRMNPQARLVTEFSRSPDLTDKAALNRLVSKGACLLFVAGTPSHTLEVEPDAGVEWIGWDESGSGGVQGRTVAQVSVDLTHFYEHVLQQTRVGQWQAGQIAVGLRHGVFAIVADWSKFPAGAKLRVEEALRDHRSPLAARRSPLAAKDCISSPGREQAWRRRGQIQLSRGRPRC